MSRFSFFRKPPKHSSSHLSQLVEPDNMQQLQDKIARLVSDIDMLQCHLKKARSEAQSHRKTRKQHADAIKQLVEQHSAELAAKEVEHQQAIEAMKIHLEQESSSRFEEEKAALISEMQRKHKDEIDAFRKHINSLETKEQEHKDKLARLKEELGLVRKLSEKTDEEYRR
ncbi:hypothetical protein EON65_55600, partial [archaeon]